MAQSSSFLQLLALIFICMLVNTPQGGAVITCNDVFNNLLPCLGYVTGGGEVSSVCCSGVKTLLNLAKTTTDSQTACSCLKPLAALASDDEMKRAQSIPKSCDVTIPFDISRDVDCSKVQ